MSTPNIAPPAESLVAFFQDGIETVLICDADPDRRARVKAGFDETSYRFSEPATPDDALRQMRFHDFHVIVVHEEFGAADPADNPVLKHLGQLPMATRRNVFVALLKSNRFADVFAHLKRAPNSLGALIARIPGVAAAQTGVSVQVTLDIPTLDEPASGMVRSLPDFSPPELNRLFLRSGGWLAPDSRGEILAGEAFAYANGLKPGDRIALLLNGRRREFRIAGIVLSPEFIFE